MSNDTFQWTDLLACEWAGYLEEQLKVKSIIDMQSILFKWKQSKTHKNEYEVIQIVNKKGGTIFKDRDDISWAQYADLHSFEGFTIKKVKRLSDNEVFSIGDPNEYSTGLVETIKEFMIIESITTRIVFRTDNDWYNLFLAKKPQQKKERIEVKAFYFGRSYGSYEKYCIQLSKKISPDQIAIIQSTIDRVLNGDPTLEEQLYNLNKQAEQDLRMTLIDFLNHQRDKK